MSFPTIVNRTGYLNGGFDRVVISFNNIINLNTLASSLSINGPSGAIAPTTSQGIADHAYEILLPQQTADGSYLFTLLPTLLDAEGFSLDQDADGTPGEPVDDTYTFTLIIDTVPPRITQRTPAGDVAGTLTSLDVWFSERMHAPSFSAADVTITSPSNAVIPASQIEEVGLNRFRVEFAPQTETGTYQFRIEPQIEDMAGNVVDLDHDGNAGEPADDVYSAALNLVPFDLQVGDISVNPSELGAGEATMISWNGRNNSGGPLLGDWTDAVYLSADAQWDIRDIRIATVAHTNGLAENKTYTASANAVVPGLLPGNYFIIVRSDIFNQEKESAEANNSVTFGPFSLHVRGVALGGPASAGTLTSFNNSHYYVVDIGPRSSLRLNLAGSASSQVYVGFEYVPTRLRFDQQDISRSSAKQISLTAPPSGGKYYILVYGDQLSQPAPYELLAETSPFYLTGLSPTTAVKADDPRFWVRAILTGLPNATLTGVGLTEDTAVEFIGTDNISRSVQRHEFVSPTTVRLFLPMIDWPAGVYKVRVTKDGVSRTLENAFTLAAEGEHKLEASLVVPGRVAPWGGQTLYVQYANTGTRAMPSPLFKVTAYERARIARGISPCYGDCLPRPPRFVLRPINTVQVMAVGSGSTPGILQPGDTGTVPVQFQGLTQDGGETSLSFRLGSLTADDTTIEVCPPAPAPGPSSGTHFPRTGRRRNSISVPGPECHEELFTIDYGAIEASSRPESVAPDAWHAVFLNLAANIGPLWADYVVTLADNMNYGATVRQQSNDPGELFNFEVLQASATLNPVRTLADSRDASVPSPGFPLVFRRIFGQPILSRYRNSPLGRGWSHNWDIHIQLLEKTPGVIVHGPLGKNRLFIEQSTPQAPGIPETVTKYTPSPGDHGKLTRILNGFRLEETDGTIWKFNPFYQLDSVEDPNGNRITCGYAGANLTSLTHSNGKQLLFEYSGARLVRLIDPLGPGPDDDRVTTYEYDGAGEHLVAVTKPGNLLTRYAYHVDATAPRRHALLSIEQADGTKELFNYDALGRLAETFRSCCDGGQKVTYSYDSAGTVTVRDATGRITVRKYGLDGQLVQVRDGEDRIVNFGYNTDALLSELTGPGRETYRYTYDARGALTAIEDPLRRSNTFAYESPFARLTRVTDARNNGMDYTYDTRGNLTAIIYADGSKEQFSYDARGLVTSSTNRRGGVINYTYNAVGQLTTKDYADTAALDFEYTYDAAGNLASARDSHGTNTLAFEATTDRLTRIEYPGGKWFEFQYDAVGRRTRRTDQDGKITNYEYDPAGRLDLMKDGDGNLIVDYDYDDAGRLSRKTLGNDVFTTRTYNQAGQVLDLINHKPDGSILSSFTYTYDASGRRTSMTTLAGTENYGYDPLGQLTGVVYPNGRVVTYEYDATGNRTHVTDNGVPTPYAANPLNQYTSAGNATFGYDLDGNQTSKIEGGVTTNYEYDSENRLIHVATPTDTWTYEYDAFGNRIAATHNGETTHYVIDPTGLGNVAAEYDGGGSLIARYEHGLGLLARADAAGNPAFYTFSAIGHTSELTDPTGAVANSYSYDPFGISLAKAETIPNSFQFVGEFGVMNEGNGLEFMRARHYSSPLGRFVVGDPIHIRGGLNLYTYVGNIPTRAIDPLGTCIILRDGAWGQFGGWLTWNCGGPNTPSDYDPRIDKSFTSMKDGSHGKNTGTVRRANALTFFRLRLRVLQCRRRLPLRIRAPNLRYLRPSHQGPTKKARGGPGLSAIGTRMTN